jgi:folate-dependent phosphoribosylglycinamide formyltransferase PurN
VPKNKRPRVAVFASGGGTTFRAVADAIHDGVVDFDIVLVITDIEDAGILQQVAEVNKLYGFTIAFEIINKKRYPDGPQGRGQTQGETKATIAALKKYKVDHLCLMGCLRIIGEQVIDEYGWRPEYAAADPAHKGKHKTRMTNTHPGILPATGDTFGIHTQEKVLALKLPETAHTFHAVATGVDAGPIIAENRVRAYETDTPEGLFARVQRIEKAHLPLDLDAFLKDQQRVSASA